RASFRTSSRNAICISLQPEVRLVDTVHSNAARVVFAVMKVRQGRPTIAEIDRAALRWNLGQVRSRVKNDVTLMAVLKADAYGHALAEVGRVLKKEGVKAFGVATVEEGVAIRDAAVVHPEILVLAGFVNDQVEPIFQHRLTPLVCDLEMARLL